jgi:uncharacterized protein YbjT (DUF2867 family)
MMNRRSILLDCIVQAEKIIEDSGIPFTFLRPNFFMHNFVNFYLCKNQSSIYLPAGDGKVSFVDVLNIAAVAIQALTRNEEGLHSGKAYTSNILWRSCQNFVGAYG